MLLPFIPIVLVLTPPGFMQQNGQWQMDAKDA
jgi:hypothetical protein